MRRIGVILPSTLEIFSRHLAEFRVRLAKLGWSEGTNLEIEIGVAENRADRTPALLGQAVARKVEVIVVVGTAGARAAKELSMGIPVVFTQHGDPVGSGLVASLARPGGHVTGTSLQFTDTAGKQIELLKALVPKLERVAELRSPAHDKFVFDVSALFASAAARLGVGLIHLDADKAADIEPAFAAAARVRIQAMVVGALPLYFSESAHRAVGQAASDRHDVRRPRPCRRRWARELRTGFRGLVRARGALRRQDPAWREAGGPAG